APLPADDGERRRRLIACSGLTIDGSADLRHPEVPRYPEGTALLQGAPGEDPPGRPGPAPRLGGGAAALRPEIRGGGIARPGGKGVPGPRPSRGAPTGESHPAPS